MLHIDAFLRAVVCTLYGLAIAFTFLCFWPILGIEWASLACLIETIVPLACIVVILLKAGPDDRG